MRRRTTERQVSPTQINMLQERGLDGTNLSYDQTYDLIGLSRLTQNPRRRIVRHQILPEQTRILDQNGINGSNLTYDEAYTLIGLIDLTQEE